MYSHTIILKSTNNTFWIKYWPALQKSWTGNFNQTMQRFSEYNSSVVIWQLISLLCLSVSLFGNKWVQTEFQFLNLTENRTRHARGPVQNIKSVTFNKLFGESLKARYALNCDKIFTFLYKVIPLLQATRLLDCYTNLAMTS